MSLLTLLIGIPLVVVLFMAIKLRPFWSTFLGKWVLWFGLVGSAAGTAGFVWLILEDRSSTAAIALLWTPFIVLLTGTVGGLAGWSFFQIRHSAAAFRGNTGARLAWFASMAFVAAAAWLAVFTTSRVSTFYRLQAAGASPALLERAYREAMARRDYFHLSAIAANSNTPRSVLLEMAASPDPGLHQKRSGGLNIFDRDGFAPARKLLQNPRLPEEALPALARSTDPYVLSDLAAHPRTPEHILRDIYKRRDEYLIPWGLTANPKTPPDLLEAIYREGPRTVADTFRSVQVRLAMNPATPAKILQELAAHPDALVRRHVAFNPAADLSLMEKLARDTSEEVRLYLAMNAALPPPLVDVLKKDGSERVRRTAGEEWRRKKSAP